MYSSGIRITSLGHLSLNEVVALINRVYVGYPGTFSPEDPVGYSAFCREQAVDWARSVLACDAAGAPIGLGLLAIRQERGWIGDFGVVPEWRRQGVGRALVQGVLDSARAAGLHEVQLEVNGANPVAQALYAAAGFRVTRPLHSYEATAGALGHGDRALTADLALPAVDAGVLAVDLGLLADPTPAWDHELPALLSASGTRTLLAMRDQTPAGLLHYAPGPEHLEIRRLAVRGGAVPVAQALLRAAASGPATRFVVAYVGATSPLFALLPALGFHEQSVDYEMLCAL